MKRMTALLLAVVMALAATAALAADYTVEEKFYRQMLQNGTKATVTLSAKGVAGLPGGGLTLNIQNCINRGNGEALASLSMGGQESKLLEMRYDGKLTCLKTPLLTDEWLAAPADWEWSRMLAPLLNGGKATPPLWHLIAAVYQAPAEWKKQAEPKAAVYQNKLGLWVNGYAASATGTDENGVLYSELSCSVPAEALKEEMKLLLKDLYADSALLSLLRQIALPEETVYLTPSALPYFTAWVDSMKLNGTVEILRRYDASAQPLLDSVRLPFAEGQPLSLLTLAVSAEKEGQRTQVLAETPDGAALSLSFTLRGEGGFFGEISIKQAGENAPGKGLRYDCAYKMEEETYSLTTDLCERAIHGTLDVTPLEGTPLPPQKLTLEALFSTRSEKRSPSTLTASLVWQDLSTDASVTIEAEARTTAGWAVGTVDELPNVVRLDKMSGDELAALVRNALSALTAQTAEPTTSPTDAPAIAPTDVPTAAPTITPTIAPTDVPTVALTITPADAPTIAPTDAPTAL